MPDFSRNTAAIIVTFFPSEDFEDRLDAVATQVKKVIVVDNTPSDKTDQLVFRLRNRSCHVIRNHSNLGVARALNLGILWAAEQGFDFVLTLDQDSRVHPGLIELYISSLSLDLIGKDVGVLNTRYIDIYTGKMGVVFSGKNMNGWMDVPAMITSGSFFSIATYKRVGPFRDDFFLDWADHDFCLRARARGLRNYIYDKPFLDHALGQKTEHTIFFGKASIVTNNHSVLRCYLISRNLIVLLKENLNGFF